MAEKKKAAGAAPEERDKGKDFSGNNKNFQSISLAEIDAAITSCAVRIGDEPAMTGRQLLLSALGLRREVRGIAQTVAECKQCPQEYVIGAMFAVAGAAAGKAAEIVFDEYHNYPCLWLLAVGDPSSGKSAPLFEMAAPLLDADAASYADFTARVAEAAKDKDNKTAPKWYEQICLSDSSPEAMYSFLAEHERGAFLVRDELGGLIHDFGRYNTSGEIERLTSIWVNEKFSVNRKTSQPIFLNKPMVCMLGGTQIRNLRKTFLREDLRDNGFSARWLYVLAQPTGPKKYSARKIPRHIRAAWRDIVARLTRMEYKQYRLDDAARVVFESYFNRVELEMSRESDAVIAEYMAKLRYYAFRWALITHLLNGDTTELITAEEMRYSVDCMEYFLSTARELFAGVQPKTRPIGDEEALAHVWHRYHPQSQSALAHVLGLTPQAVQKVVTKYKGA